MEFTKKFWHEIQKGEYEIVLSDLVFSEIGDCPEPKKSILLKYLQEINYSKVTINDDVYELANKYIEQKVLPPKCLEDALHISLASISGCNVIVSWNFKHMVNLKTFFGVNGINKIFGCGEIVIVPPNEIVDEEE